MCFCQQRQNCNYTLLLLLLQWLRLITLFQTLQKCLTAISKQNIHVKNTSIYKKILISKCKKSWNKPEWLCLYQAAQLIRVQSESSQTLYCYISSFLFLPPATEGYWFQSCYQIVQPSEWSTKHPKSLSIKLPTQF